MIIVNNIIIGNAKPRTLAVNTVKGVHHLSLSQTQRFLKGICVEDRKALKQGAVVKGHFYSKKKKSA